MKLSKAKKLEIGDMITLHNDTGRYTISHIDKNLSNSKRILFWCGNIVVDHKEIEKKIEGK